MRTPLHRFWICQFPSSFSHGWAPTTYSNKWIVSMVSVYRMFPAASVFVDIVRTSTPTTSIERKSARFLPQRKRWETPKSPVICSLTKKTKISLQYPQHHIGTSNRNDSIQPSCRQQRMTTRTIMFLPKTCRWVNYDNGSMSLERNIKITLVKVNSTMIVFVLNVLSRV